MLFWTWKGLTSPWIFLLSEIYIMFPCAWNGHKWHQRTFLISPWTDCCSTFPPFTVAFYISESTRLSRLGPLESEPGIHISHSSYSVRVWSLKIWEEVKLFLGFSTAPWFAFALHLQILHLVPQCPPCIFIKAGLNVSITKLTCIFVLSRALLVDVKR